MTVRFINPCAGTRVWDSLGAVFTSGASRLQPALDVVRPHLQVGVRVMMNCVSRLQPAYRFAIGLKPFWFCLQAG